MSIAQAFDELVSEYSQSIVRWVPNYQNLLEGVIRYLPKGFQADSILELGCGNGNLSLLALHKFPNAHFEAVDISSEMIAMSRQRLTGKNPVFHKCYIQDYYSEPAKFDWVIAAMALHHLPGADKQKLFKSVFQWLKPGGVFCVADLVIEKEDRPFHDQHLKFWKTHAYQKATTDDEWKMIIDHYADYDRPNDWLQQIEWLEEAGFQEVDTPFRKIGWTNLVARKI